MRFKDLKIGVKLSSIIFVILFLLSSFFYVADMYVQDKLLGLEIQDRLRHTKDMFYNIKERDTHILTSALDVFLQNQDFKKVYLEGDREKLFRYGQPLFQNLKADHGITHFYFILPDGRCFVRLHNKDIYGDRIDRVTFKQAEAVQRLAAGIELGKTAFALRAVSPYYQNNELIGYVEVGEEIEHFLEILKGESSDEFAIIADKEYIGREDWARSRRIAGLKDNWDDMNKHVLIARTSKDAALSEFFIESNVEYAEKGPQFIKRIHIGNKFFAGSGFPLTDPNGKDIGVVLTLDDITDFVINARRADFILLGISAILFPLSILFFSIFISKIVVKPIGDVRSGVIQISQGNLNKRLEVESSDEIGELAELFNKMIIDLSTSRNELVAVRDYTDSIIASMIDALIVINPDGTIRTVNKAVCDLLGYREEELVGKNVNLIFSEEEEEEEEEIDMILEKIEASAILVSRDYKILKANRALLQGLGFKKEDVIGQFCYKITHRRDSVCVPPHDICPILEASGKNKPCVELHTHIDKSGTQALVNVIAAPIVDGLGNTLYYLHLSSKLGEREKFLAQQQDAQAANELMRKLNAYVKKIEETAAFKALGIRRLIGQGSIRNLETTYKAKTGEKIPVFLTGSVLRDKREKLLGVTIVARDMRRMFNLLEELKKSKAEIESYSRSLESLVDKKTAELKGKIADLEDARRVTLSILEDTDEARKNLENALDKLKSTQAQLVQAGKLAGIGQMAAGVAHEINNPLTSIMGFAQLTMSRKDLDATLRADLLTIEKEAKRCVTIIENLLSFARPQAPQKIKVNVNNVLEATLKIVEYSLSMEQVKIVKKYQDAPPEITGDPSQLQQVFMNIILNAVHAMPRGGELTVETSAQCTVNSAQGAVNKKSLSTDHCPPRPADSPGRGRLNTDSVSVSFTDTGVGISPENMEKIFEPFFTTSYKTGYYKGTGLGLSISHSIVQAHGGRIEVESEVDKGSTFRVILPV